MVTGATPTPLVSVVIPAFNNADYLEAAVESVLDQEDVEFELIISDHGSSDRTLEIARGFESDPRVTVLTAPAGGGAVANWNFVTKHARGHLLKLVCGDDTLLPGVLSRQAQIFQAHPEVALAACRRDVIGSAGTVRFRNRGLQGMGSRVGGLRAVGRAVRSGTNPFGEPACVMIRCSALDQVGGWWGDHPYVIDLATYFRVLEHGDFAADRVTGATFRLTVGQQSASMTRAAADEVGWLASWARQRYPQGVTRADVWIGAIKRSALGHARSLLYVVLRIKQRRR